MQLNFCVNEERLENLYTVSAFAALGESKNKDPAKKLEEETKGKEKQKAIIEALKKIGNEQFKKWDLFEEKVKKTLKEFDLSPNFINCIVLALSEHDVTAEYVLERGKRQADANLRDSEKIALEKDIDTYFQKEVISYYADAWMDRSKDRIGYEINFAKYFYKYEAPRAIEIIEKEIKEVSSEIQALLNGEHKNS